MRKDCIARELTMEAVVGVFMIMILLGLGYFTIILSSNKLFEKKYPIKIEFKKIMGLRNGDSIVIRGMTAGKVSDITLSNNGVSITGTLKEELVIHKGYKMAIVQTSILGGRQLEIDAGPQDAEILPSDTVFRGITPNDLMADAGEVISSFKKNMVDNDAIGNLSKTADNLYQISERLNNGEGFIGKLLSPDNTMYNDLSSSMASLRKLADRIESGKGTIGRLLSEDDTLYTDMEASMAALRKLTERLESGKGTMGKLLSEDDTLYTDLESSVTSLQKITARLETGKGTLGHLLSEDDTLYNDLSSTMASLKIVTKHLEDGDGLLGKMLTDDQLYNQLSGIINEAMEVLDDYRETSPVVTFTSVFFGAL
jgi:phospholipid/cholesterol/gamma-HCH transport system substrate-binding protein